MYKVGIVKDPVRMTLGMSFYEEMPGGNIRVAAPVHLDFLEYMPGDMVPGPTFTIPAYFAENFLKAIAEALDGHGIKTDNDARIAGTLEATRDHLEDMRTLLKLPRKAPAADF